MVDRTVEEKKSLQKRVLNSVLFFAGVLLIAFGLLILRFVLTDKEAAAKSVVVEADGSIVYAVPLSDDQTIPVQTEYGENIVRIENGKVFVESADCPKQICVHTAPIRDIGQTIVCLPHRVVISVTSIDLRKKE
ncbi:MAG: NusG domain II-containing protein [Lachnospiraceae bacterium]|nr:NusG domain II-containing protein [Lachnospiraceae bacterium]